MATIPELADGITLLHAEEIGLPSPSIVTMKNKSLYVYAREANTTMPAVGDYIAQPMEEDGTQFNEILKVIMISENGFTAEPVSLSEITARPVVLSGSVRLSVD